MSSRGNRGKGGVRERLLVRVVTFTVSSSVFVRRFMYYRGFNVSRDSGHWST